MAKKEFGVDIDFGGNALLDIGKQNFVSSSINTVNINISPAPNFTFTGVQDCNALILTHVGTASLTGLEAPNPVAAKTILIINGSGSNLILFNNDSRSLPENRFLWSRNMTLNANEGIWAIYDPINLRWRLISY